MKVLHLLGSTEDIGGILSVIRNLQTASADRGVQHFIWVNERYREVRRPALTYRFSRHLLGESPSHLRLLWEAVRALKELRALLATESFDVLHAHTRGACALAMQVAAVWRRPVLFTNHTYGSRRAMYRWAARLPRFHCTVLTPNMARHYGLAVDRVRIVSESCADSFFELPLAPRRALAGRTVRLVGLGNIVRWKNWHLIIEAIAQLAAEEQRRLEFHHWGPVPDDPECAAYERALHAAVQTRNLAGRVCFHGLSLSVQEPLREADFFVLPSTNEPCSVALIEALALGIPAVVSASGGNVDIIAADRTGLLFVPDDAASLRDAFRRILAGPVPLAAAAAVRESVRQRSASAVATEYLKIYAEQGVPSAGLRATANGLT